MTANVVPMARPNLAATVRGYISLTKPRVISLLLVTTVPAMVVAHGGWPSGWLILWTLVGGSLSAGGANAINCWYDRDIDAVMRRTQSRPMVTGVIEPSHALAFGIGLGALAFVLLWVATTLAAAMLALAALLFYVFIYTMWLKRRTPQNIVIGGAAGAFPPMVGWAAVTGDVSLAPVVMFLIVFFWTPPHFWALALRLQGDYTEAGVPMLPVIAGPEVTRIQIFRYSVMLVLVTLMLAPAAGLGAVYVGACVVLGGLFLFYAGQLWRTPQTTPPIRLYKYSLLYLALLFMAMGADVLLLG
ncbi:MAG: protoheme IX farnesyltransferase [Chloroflexi bacterium]|jgi:protoheme IX farnesyltransferase|nr:heme o synthase [Dehalococcoidia bacterium]NJD65325.1 protoheme IX farnesyltransferase [Chloroflexota bacterium]PWB45211.1 MAG: protoheme IX farnesyltransferase [Dehalococcoidia bacterium]